MNPIFAISTEKIPLPQVSSRDVFARFCVEGPVEVWTPRLDTCSACINIIHHNLTSVFPLGRYVKKHQTPP